MRFYKDKDGEIHAFDDDCDAEFLKQAVADRGLTAITEAAADAILNPIDALRARGRDIAAHLNSEYLLRHAGDTPARQAHWGVKLALAKEIKGGTASDTDKAKFSKIASARGQTADELANKIVEKSEQFYGKKWGAEAALETCLKSIGEATNKADIDAAIAKLEQAYADSDDVSNGNDDGGKKKKGRWL